MRTLEPALVVFSLLAVGCSPPPVLHPSCTDDCANTSTPGTLGLHSGSGGGGDGGTTTGTDASSDASAGTVSGTVYLLQEFPSTTAVRAALPGAPNWAVSSRFLTTPVDLSVTDSAGAFSLTNTALLGTDLYLQAAPAAGTSASGITNMLRVEPGAAGVRLPLVSQTTLQTVASGLGVTLDPNTGHAWVEFVAASGVSPQGVTVATAAGSVGFIAYDIPGQFTQSTGATGASGLVLLLNIPIPTGYDAVQLPVVLSRGTSAARQTVSVVTSRNQLSYRTIALTL